ncbi:uncharacterized protein LOC128921348 [Zeugodacus cucurbitae]|uniref:uncharacterized protein LOC128921348 n=1 Tax=Zeugodacus cucurbitae TaxID=28588 RepID=UPI0023D95E4B|nr:uncharacterized protein LOC128921348 [Zeugodacus cucurbitae]
MRSTATAATNTKNPNPLQDDDLSELTKKEILFWARKLKLTPSELFTLSKHELEYHLERAQQEDLYEEQRQSQFAKWEMLSQMKRFLLEEQHKERLRGGGPQATSNRRTVWDILCRAASEIESMYGQSQACIDSSADSCPYSDTGGSSSYATSTFGGFESPRVPNMCSTMYEMHPDDSQCTPPDFPSTFTATPISCARSPQSSGRQSRALNATHNMNVSKATFSTCPKRNASRSIDRGGAPNATYNACAPRNATYTMPNDVYSNACPPRNTTYSVPRGANATYDACRSQAGNATYNVGSFALNATYNVPHYGANTTYNVPRFAPNATYNFSRCAPNATYNASRCPPNATFNVPRSAPNATYNIPHSPTNATFNVSRLSPNATYNVPRCALNATFNLPRARNTTQAACPNATFNATHGGNRTFNATMPRGNVTFNVCPRSGGAGATPSFCPNPVMASTPKNCQRTGQPPYFRNYTDYWMTLSGMGMAEATQSVSYDLFSDNKSMVRAAARTYSIPLPNRSKSCPPIGRTTSPQYGYSSGDSIPCPRGATRTPSPIRCSSPVQAIAAVNYGMSPVARPTADRSYGAPRRLRQRNTNNEFCDCARRSHSVPPRCCS